MAPILLNLISRIILINYLCIHVSTLIYRGYADNLLCGWIAGHESGLADVSVKNRDFSWWEVEFPSILNPGARFHIFPSVVGFHWYKHSVTSLANMCIKLSVRHFLARDLQTVWMKGLPWFPWNLTEFCCSTEDWTKYMFEKNRSKPELVDTALWLSSKWILGIVVLSKKLEADLLSFLIKFQKNVMKK